MINNTVDNTVHIVAPYSIDIQIREFTNSSWESVQNHNFFEKGKADTPFDNVWNLIQDREYYIRVFLYDDKMNQILITPNVLIKVTFINKRVPNLSKFAFEPGYVDIIEARNHELKVKPTKLTDFSKLTFSLEEVKSAKGIYKPP